MTEHNTDADRQHDAATILDYIDGAAIEEAIGRHASADHSDATTASEVREALSWVQRSMEACWRDWLAGVENGDATVVYEDADVVVFATGEHDIPRRDLREHYDGDLDERVPDIVSAIHHDLARELCDYDWGVEYPLVVAKRDGIEDAQRYFESVINGLLGRGLSPGQAWAYYGVEIRGHSRNQWAERCDYADHSTVSEAVRKAKRKLW